MLKVNVVDVSVRKMDFEKIWLASTGATLDITGARSFLDDGSDFIHEGSIVMGTFQLTSTPQKLSNLIAADYSAIEGSTFSFADIFSSKMVSGLFIPAQNEVIKLWYHQDADVPTWDPSKEFDAGSDIAFGRIPEYLSGSGGNVTLNVANPEWWKYAFYSQSAGNCYWDAYDAAWNRLDGDGGTPATYTTDPFTLESLLAIHADHPDTKYVSAYFTTAMFYNLTGDKAGAIGTNPTGNSPKVIQAQVAEDFGGEVA